MVTKCRHPRRSEDLTSPSTGRIIARCLLRARARGRCHLLACCLMPDHLHMLVSPRIAAGTERSSVGAPSSGRSLRPLSRFVADWASASAHLMNRALGTTGPVWQEGFYDHAIRRSERLWDVVDYIHQNPVRRGLAATAEAWSWSSANPEFSEQTDWDWYVGNRREDPPPTER